MVPLVVALGLLGQAAAERVVCTADVNVRGPKATDLPGERELATNVYTFEQIDPTLDGGLQ
jgi:hypothetical protein